MEDLINLSSPIKTKCLEPKLASPLIPLPENEHTSSPLSILKLGECNVSSSDNPFDSALEKVNDYLSKCQDPFEIINQQWTSNIAELSSTKPTVSSVALSENAVDLLGGKDCQIKTLTKDVQNLSLSMPNLESDKISTLDNLILNGTVHNHSPIVRRFGSYADISSNNVNNGASNCNNNISVITDKNQSPPSRPECRIDEISPITRRRNVPMERVRSLAYNDSCESGYKGNLSNTRNILDLLDEYQRLKTRIFASPNKTEKSSGDGEMTANEETKNLSDLLDSKKSPLDMLIQSEAKILSQTFGQLASKSQHEMNNTEDDLLPAQLPYDVHLSLDESAIENLIELNPCAVPEEHGSTDKNEYHSQQSGQSTADAGEELAKQLFESEKKREAALLLKHLEKIAQTENNSKAVELLHNVSKALGVEYCQNSKHLNTNDENPTSESEQPLTTSNENMSPDSTEISNSPARKTVCDSSEQQNIKIDESKIISDLTSILHQMLSNYNENSKKPTGNLLSSPMPTKLLKEEDSNTRKAQSSLEKRPSSPQKERKTNLTSLKSTIGRKISLSTPSSPSHSGRRSNTSKILGRKISVNENMIKNIPVLPQKIKLKTPASTVDKNKFQRKLDNPAVVKKGPLKAVCSFGTRTPVKLESDTLNFGQATSTPNPPTPDLAEKKNAKQVASNIQLPTFDSPRRTKSHITPPAVSSLRRASSLIENPSLKRASISRIASPILKSPAATSSTRFSSASRRPSLQSRLISPKKTGNQSGLKRPDINRRTIGGKLEASPGIQLKESNKHVIKGKPINSALKPERRCIPGLTQKENKVQQ